MVGGEVVDGEWGDVKVGGSWIEGVLVKGEEMRMFAQRQAFQGLGVHGVWLRC